MELKELPPIGVRALVTFAYSRDDPLSVEAVVPAWVVADQYLCHSLADRCSQEVSAATALSTLTFLAEAERLQHPPSNDAALARLQELLAGMRTWVPSEVDSFATEFKRLPVALARQVIRVLPTKTALDLAETYGLASFGPEIPFDCSRLALPDLARVVRAGVLSFDEIGNILSAARPAPCVYRCLEPARVAAAPPLLVQGQEDRGCLDRGAVVAVLEQRMIDRDNGQQSMRFRFKLLSSPHRSRAPRVPTSGWVSEVATDGTRLLEQFSFTD